MVDKHIAKALDRLLMERGSRVILCDVGTCDFSTESVDEATAHLRGDHGAGELYVDEDGIYDATDTDTYRPEIAAAVNECLNDDPTQRSINTDPAYWQRYAESLMPAAPQQGKDYVLEYGVFVEGSRVRHFINKPAGGNVTLCGLPCVFVRGASIDAERTCEKCAARQTEMRRR